MILYYSLSFRDWLPSGTLLYYDWLNYLVFLFQVFLVREKVGGEIFAMKVLRKDNIIKRNQVKTYFGIVFSI